MGESSSHYRGVFRIARGSLRLFYSSIASLLYWFFGEWFSQAGMTPYERAHRGRTLSTILKVIFAAAVAIFGVNIYISAWNIAIAVLMVPLFCIPAFWLNSRGRHLFSSSLILIVLLCVANYNLYSTGGLQDSGMLVYPLIIIVGSLFLGKRAIPVLTFASVGSLGCLHILRLKESFCRRRSQPTQAFVCRPVSS